MPKMLFALLFATLLAVADGQASRVQAADRPRIDSMAGVWSIALGFGEIPVLANSAKVSVSAGYHFNNYVYLGGIVQFPDVIERGSESFNARNLGLDGLLGTRERTGVRALLHARVRPHRYSPFLSAGMLFNGTDSETMHFDGVVVTQSRPWAVNPAVGLGYEVTFRPGITVSLELTGAFFLKPRKPAVNVVSKGMDEARRAAIAQSAEDSFGRNFHNRYRLFNMAVGYAW